MDEAGKVIWPPDLAGRQTMARGLFGVELVSNVDFWTLLAEDELDDTHQAPWASAERKSNPEELRRRAVLKTLNSEQREAVRELIRRAVKGELHSFCVAIDRTCGSSTISIETPNDGYGQRLEIHSPQQDEIHHELFEWLEKYSIVFGEDERA
jgi:hypothetical protein